jgi:hypothetical protein
MSGTTPPTRPVRRHQDLVHAGHPTSVGPQLAAGHLERGVKLMGKSVVEISERRPAAIYAEVVPDRIQ